MNEKLTEIENQLIELSTKILGGLDEFIEQLNQTNKPWEKINNQLKDAFSTEEK